MTVRDALGVEVREGDTARIIAYGYGARLSEVGQVFVVSGFTRGGRVLHTCRAVGGPHREPIGASVIAVQRRDGQPGHEGNLPEHREAFLASLAVPAPAESPEQ